MSRFLKLRLLIFLSIFFSLSFISASEICQYATSASSTSENPLGSLASHATGPPNAPFAGQCTIWSGYGYSWSPNNWDVKANLTLKYAKPVYASNLTIMGDYDMCWRKISLRNSVTKVEKVVLNNFDSSCISIQQLQKDFLADSIILENCGWSWSSTDAVQICGEPESPQNNTPPVASNNATICDWKDCKKGAVSISVDDGSTACSAELNAYNYKGTFFLSDTQNYGAAKWRQINNLQRRGHELAAHTRDHWCIEQTSQAFFNDVDKNINDILKNTNATKKDIVSFAYPCGFTTAWMENSLATNPNWNFISSRGYNFNELEDKTPQDIYNLKSYNSKGYPGDDLEPPSYFSVVNDAESKGKWANLIFHNECDDDGVISYLPTRNVWVDTQGNVARYIKLRDNTQITDLVYSKTGVSLKTNTPVAYVKDYYTQSISLKIGVDKSVINKINVNGNNVAFKVVNEGGKNYAIFNVPMLAENKINIVY